MTNVMPLRIDDEMTRGFRLVNCGQTESPSTAVGAGSTARQLGKSLSGLLPGGHRHGSPPARTMQVAQERLDRDWLQHVRGLRP